LNVAIQALGAPVLFSGGADLSPAQDPTNGTMKNSPMGGRSGPPSAQPPAGGVGSGSRTTSEANSAALGPNSHGVLGLRGLTLTTAPANNAMVSVLTSDGKNVHLDSGTQFLLVEQNPEAPAR